jgi:hypothetical protein
MKLHAASARRDFATALWTACCVTLALALLFAFFFRMEESVARQLDTRIGAEAEWAQRHWQCSAVPVMKQAVCEAQLARAVPAGPIETADASAALNAKP